MTLKLWDVNMGSAPVRTIKVHEHLRPKLCELYESDCIFDKFECRWGHDSNHVCTGTYDNKLLMWDVYGDGHTALESVSTSPSRRASLKGASPPPSPPARASSHPHPHRPAGTRARPPSSDATSS